MSFRTLPRRQVIITFIGIFLAIFLSTYTGFGLGITFPIYTIAAQNAVPYKVMGDVVSSIPFSRFIGGTPGRAILGSVLNNSFSSDFISKLPPSIRTAIPPQTIAALTQNPQTLICPQAQDQIRNVLNSAGLQSDYNQVLQALRDSLVTGLAKVFFISLIVPWLLLLIYLLKKFPCERPAVRE
jgi:hypothetical protein